MNHNIRPRERMGEPKDTNADTFKKEILDNQIRGKKNLHLISNTKKILAPKSSNLTCNSSLLQRGLSPRDREMEKIIFQERNYEFVIIDINQFERGVKVILNSDNQESITSQMVFNMQTMEIQKNRVNHTFPMPGLSNSTKLIKINLKKFQMSTFRVLVQSLKGKLKEKNVMTDVPQQYDFTSTTTQIDPFLLIEEAENFRRRKFCSIEKPVIMNSCKSIAKIQNLTNVNTKPQKETKIIEKQKEAMTPAKKTTNSKAVSIAKHSHKPSNSSIGQNNRLESNNKKFAPSNNWNRKPAVNILTNSLNINREESKNMIRRKQKVQQIQNLKGSTNFTELLIKQKNTLKTQNSEKQLNLKAKKVCTNENYKRKKYAMEVAMSDKKRNNRNVIGESQLFQQFLEKESKVEGFLMA